MDKKELIEEIDKALLITKDFNTMKHIFSDDAGEKTLSDLNRTLGRVNFMIAASDIKEIGFPVGSILTDGIGCKKGALVAIRPVAEKYGKKTYLGFYLGDMATGSGLALSEDMIHVKYANHNPAIFVPELGVVLFGYESWWGEITGEDDFKKITDVRMWKAMAAKDAAINDNPEKVASDENK